jgi:hypothetical protein
VAGYHRAFFVEGGMMLRSMRNVIGLMVALAAAAPLAAEDAAPATVAEAVALAERLARASGAGERGVGQAALAAQADRIARVPADGIVPCLAAYADATPAGANWLRSGLERAVEQVGIGLSADALAAVVADAKQPARARVLAFPWLRERDRQRAEELLDTLLDDPALDLRREAVERQLAMASAGDEAVRKTVYRRCLAAARDVDQIERIAAWLAEHGEKVDVAEVLGFVRRWRVSEAFDNSKGVGFGKAYPPESAGVGGSDAAAWKPVESTDKHGAIDLNAAIATKKGVLAYAGAEVVMPRAGPAEVRIGSPCAVAVWVNGVPVMAHEIYHASEAIDQYVAAADFRAGVNAVLVKCCQNEQTEPWAADWKFQLRICDAVGTPLATQPGPLPRK